MAWRESRTGRARLILFSLAISFGVAALVAIGSLGRSLRQTIDAHSRALLGADLKPATAASSIELEVEPSKNQLTVNVQHPEVAPAAREALRKGSRERTRTQVVIRNVRKDGTPWISVATCGGELLPATTLQFGHIHRHVTSKPPAPPHRKPRSTPEICNALYYIFPGCA